MMHQCVYHFNAEAGEGGLTNTPPPQNFGGEGVLEC